MKIRPVFLAFCLFMGVAQVNVVGQDASIDSILTMARNARKQNVRQRGSIKLSTYSKSILRLSDRKKGPYETRAITLRHTDIYWQAPDRKFEIITAQRHLQDLKWVSYEPFDLGLIMDFGLDRITVGSVSVMGPLSRESDSMYRFELDGADTTDGHRECYIIRIEPRYSNQPLMEGTMWLSKKDGQLCKADVRFNDAVKIFPQPERWIFEQEFDTVGGAWLPKRATWELYFDLNFIAWRKFAVWRSELLVSHATINGRSDEWFISRRAREFAPDAEFKDSIFWAENQEIPLTPDESADFEHLKQIGKNAKVVYPDIESFQAKQREENVHVGFRIRPDGRYNRVEGLYAGAEMGLNNFAYRQIIRDLTLRTTYGYGFADKRYKYRGEIKKGFRNRTVFIGAQYYNDITFKELNGNLLSNSVGAFFYRFDALNYFYIRGYDFYAQWRPSHRWKSELRYSDRLDRNTRQNTSYALFKQFYTFEPVYPITEGRLRRVSSTSTVQIGEGEGIAPRNAYWIINGTIDYTDHDFLKSDFHFARYYGTARFHFPTTRRGSLDGKLYLGYGTDKVPQQYLFDLTGEYPPYLMKTTDILESEGNHFAGNYLAQLCIEHNFGGTILEKTGLPYLKKGNVDITPFVNIGFVRLTKLARTVPANAAINDMEKPLVEAGFGIGNIHRIVRVDFAWRLTRRQTGNRNFSIVTNFLLQNQ